MIISRYLTREVFNATVAVTIVLLLAFLSQQMVRYLNYVAVGKIPTHLFLALLSFEIPYLLALLLPMGLYLGILLAFGRLGVDNEMAILQMAGFSDRRLIRTLLFLIAAFFLMILVLMLWVNPTISAKRQQLMTKDEATLHMIQTLIPGRFQASPDGHHVMYVERLSRDHERAKNVFLAKEEIAHKNKKKTWMIVIAKEGYQVRDKETSDHFFVTRDGFRYKGVPGQNDYRVTQFKTYQIRIPQNEVRMTNQEDETLSTEELWKEYQNPKKAAELQWRFSVAICCVILAFLAIPLSKMQPRKARYLAIFPAVLIYIIYFNLLIIARRWLEQGSVPVSIGLWWVHGSVLLFAMVIYLTQAIRKH